MKKWEEKLSSLPTDEAGRKKGNESSFTEIIFLFMKEEIYTRLKSAKDSFPNSGLNIAIFPASPEDISTTQPIVYMTVQKPSNGNSNECSLKFNQQDAGLIIDTTLIGRHGLPPTHGCITLEGESPATLVEFYVKQLREQL